MTRKADSVLVEALCPLGFRIKLRWQTWIKKAAQHLNMWGRQDDVRLTISEPDEIQKNYFEGRVNYLYWKRFDDRSPEERYLKVAVLVNESKKEGIVLTAHPTPEITDARMYSGEKIWPQD